MPRFKKEPRKRGVSEISGVPHVAHVDFAGSNSHVDDVLFTPSRSDDMEGNVAKKSKLQAEKSISTPVDLRQVKAESTNNLKTHLKCSKEASSVLSPFQSYIRVYKGSKFKFLIGRIIVLVGSLDGCTADFDDLYGMYIGDESISLLCFEESAQNDLKEKYIDATTSVPVDIFSSLATKYFAVAYRGCFTSVYLQFDVFLTDENFPVVQLPSGLPKGGVRSDVRKVVDFFYDTEIIARKNDQKQKYISELLDNIVHEKPLDICVQHPNLIPPLRPYQCHAVQWMLSLERRSFTAYQEAQKLHPLFEPISTINGNGFINVGRSISEYSKILNAKRAVTTTAKIFNFTQEPKHALLSCKGGILADEMGLGKTVEVLACILNNPKDSCEDVNGGKRTKLNFPPELPPLSRDDMFSCCCGRTYDVEEHFDVVKCHLCGIHQHATCFNYHPMDPDQEYCCPHCWVKDSKELVSSGATLIVAPYRICYQWEEEIRKHIQDQSVTILNYEGVSQNYIQPTDLAQNDIVLTTYEVLKKELNYVDVPYSSRNTALRRPQKFYSPPSPLSAVLWWRVCLDEAQMAENPTSNTAKMALQLNAEHRWCVTGTPLQRNVNDLYGLYQFVGIDPYCIRFWWREALYKPFCNGDSKPLINAISPFMWRTLKKNVLDQINIPQQETVIHWIKLAPVEEYFYKEQCSTSSTNLNHQIRCTDLKCELKSLDKDFLCRLWIPVRMLRQASCHPQLVRGHFVSLNKTFLSMDEVLDAMIKRAQCKAEDAHRQLIGAMNGMAGLHVITGNSEEAICYYKKALTSAHMYSSTLRTDSLQLYHAFFNLADILTDERVPLSPPLIVFGGEQEKEDMQDVSSNEKSDRGNAVEHPAILEPLCREKISEEANKLSESYVQKSLAAVDSAKQSAQNLSIEVHDQARAAAMENPWWSQVFQYAALSGKDAAFIEKLISDLLASVKPGKPSIATKFRDISGLEYIIYNKLTELIKHHEALKKALYALPRVPSDNDVQMAAACHLRPPATQKNTRIMECQYCRVEEKFNAYKGKLFYCMERSSEAPKKTLQAQNNSSSEQGTSNWMNDILTGNQETWAESELERIFKAVLMFSRNSKVANELTERGNATLQWIAALKKEFRGLRNLWIKLANHAASIDELKMASQRMRLQLPFEKDVEDLPPNVISASQVEIKKHEFTAEESIARVKLQECHVKLMFLQNLRKMEEQGGREGGINKICPVCRQCLRVILNKNKKWTMLPCGHCLCSECTAHLGTKYPIPNRRTHFRCPICREAVCPKDVCYIGSDPEYYLSKEYPVKGSYSSKVNAIIRCLLQIKKEDPSAKALVFSEWMDLLNIIASALKENGIPFVLLQNKKTFQSDLLQFKRDSNINTALLPLQSCASGLNIIEATHVLLVEPLLYPSLELQAIGRVHRIGQTRKTTVHRFIVKDSIEENIYHLFYNNCKSIEEMKQKESSLTLKDIKALF